MRIILIIFDGLADRPAPELGGKTPLEAAQTPNLNRLATEGVNGLLHPKSPGYPLGSPLALHLMFGYPEAQFPDRGPLLARARGVEIATGEIALAARFASVQQQPDGSLRLVQRFVRDREEDCRALAAVVDKWEVDDLAFRYVYSGRGDGILLIGGGASHDVTDTDPLGLDLPVLACRPRADASDPEAARRTAMAINRFLTRAHSRFASALRERPGDNRPPLNFLITKWAGRRPLYEPFQQRWGLRAASLPDEEVVAGLMLELDFHVEQIEDADPERDLRRRLACAKDLLETGYEFIHLHSKYPDPASHDNQPLRVRDDIEALDAAMESYWGDLARDPTLVTVLTTDHTTPSVWSNHPRGQFSDQHSGEEVPIVIRGGNVRLDSVTEFSERAAALGALGHLRGDDFMPVLLNAAERTNMWEMRPMPARRLYRPRPDEIEPFRLA